MKALHTLSLATALLAAPTLALAGGGSTHVPGSVNVVTIALTFNHTTPNAVEKDEDGKAVTPKNMVYENEWDKNTETKIEQYYEYLAKMAVQKYGNKEFLEDLRASGILDTESIAGWSLVQVTPSEVHSSNDSESSASQYLVIHRDHEPVNVTETLDGMERAWAETANYKWSRKGLQSNPEGAVIAVSSAFNWKATLAVNVIFPTAEITLIGPPPGPEPKISLQGLYTGSQKQVFVGTGEDKRPVQLLGAQKIGLITGVGPKIPDEEAEHSVVEGTISMGAGKAVVDVTETYGVTIPEEDG